MDLPDGYFRTWSYSPWAVSASDENDTYDHMDNLHFGTPAVTHLDSLGRVYKNVELAEIGGDALITRLVLDIQGNPLAVIDPRENTIQVQRFDMLGRPLFTGAADEGYDPDSPATDKGQTRALFDVASQPFLNRCQGVILNTYVLLPADKLHKHLPRIVRVLPQRRRLDRESAPGSNT